MHRSPLERATAFEHRFTRAQASEVVELAFGYAVLQHEFPLSHYHNRLVVTSAAEPDHVLEASEEILGRAGRGHRFISVDYRITGHLIAPIEAAGYDHEVDATMLDTAMLDAPMSDAGDRFGDLGADPVEAVSLEVIRPSIIETWRADLPEATDTELEQLADRTALAERGADLTRLAVQIDDLVVARADLYLDRVDRIAQFESLVTDPAHRRKGLGMALLQSARARSHEAGCELLLLTADVDDWPYGWYQRAGFEELGRWHHLSRRIG